MVKTKKQNKDFPSKIIIIVGICFVFIPLLLTQFKGAMFGIDNGTEVNGKISDVQTDAETIAQTCLQKNGTEKHKCYEERLAVLASNKSLDYAEKALSSLQEIDPFTRSCHVLAHRIAEAATRRNPNEWKKLMEEINVSVCGAGLLHGILEAHIATEPDFKITPAFVNEICSFGPIEKRRMCSHFLAHLLLIEKEGDVDNSLPVCERVSEELAYECNIGIFMEDHQKNIMVDHNLISPPLINTQYAKDLASSCNMRQGIVAAACWAEMAEIFAKASNYDQKSVYEGCNQANHDEERTHCYLKGVIILTTYPDYDSPEKLQKICEPYGADEKLSEKCISFVISGFMNYSIHFTERGITFCSVTDNKYKDMCFRELGRQLKTLVASSTEREGLCKNAPNEYKKSCASI